MLERFVITLLILNLAVYHIVIHDIKNKQPIPEDVERP